MPPFFTIITSTYNAASTLPRLLDSLASQTCRDFNWIVQDGASSDATMQIVEQYRDRLPEVLANSSKDNGIYDAWNKAINHWQDRLGEWILFLGADDMLAEQSVLDRVQQKIQHTDSQKIFASGHILIIETATGKIIKKLDGKSNTFSKRFHGMSIPHTGLFSRKKLFTSPYFDAQFQISGDYDFILKHWTQKNQMLDLDLIITKMGNLGISQTQSSEKEDFIAIKKHSIFLACIYIIRKKIKSFF